MSHSSHLLQHPTDYKWYSYKDMSPGNDKLVLPEPAKDLSASNIVELDGRVWPTKNIYSQLRTQLAQQIVKILSGEPYSASFEVDRIWCILERPKKEEHGHFCLPIPQLRLGNGVNPVQAATDIANLLNNTSKTGNNVNSSEDHVYALEASSTGPFVNVKFTEGNTILTRVVQEVMEQQGLYGSCNIGRGKRIAIDYSSPNIAKPFHAGHLRSTIIGNFLKQVYAACGFEVLGINYLGDWGKQYGLLAVGFERYGKEDLLATDPIKHLFDVYVAINKDLEKEPELDDRARAYFKAMEEGDQTALDLWRRFRDLSIVKYREVYGRLNINFEIYSGESLYHTATPAILQKLECLLQDSQGAKTIDLEVPWKLGRALVVKRDGATLYMTRDIAAAEHRFTAYGLSKSIYVVAMQQDLHLAQLFKIVELLGEKGVFPKEWAPACAHINFGMVKGMKTRKGEVVFLTDILDEARQVMLEVMQSNPDKYAEIEDPVATADTLAVSAIVIQDMSAKRIKDYEFKLARVTQFEGDTGPYLQYAHSRLCSIERKVPVSLKSGDENGPRPYDLSTIDWSLLAEKEAFDLAWHLARFPDTVQEARVSTEPCTIVSYCMHLSQLVSSALNKLWVMGQEERVARSRLALYVAARITLGNGLKMLGLKPLERM